MLILWVLRIRARNEDEVSWLSLSESRVSQMHTSIVQRLQEQLGRHRPEFGT